jgi:CO/xanthine dehydrogenase Mo-binding subunit
MSDLAPRLQFPEPERYELSEPPPYVFQLNRREFVQTLGAGLLISMVLPDVFGQRRGGRAEATVQDRLHIATDGTITVFTSKVEVGQGSRTELAMAAAEELQVPIDRLKLTMADSAVGPNDGGTAGSRTTPDAVPSVRRGCAAARQLLLETAARKFNTEAAKLRVNDGSVEGLAQGESFSYADLAADSESLKAANPAGVQLKSMGECNVLGTPVSKVGGREVVTGARQYPSDIVRPRMLYGKVLRAPAYNSQLVKIEHLDAAHKQNGVIAVHDGNFAGVVARNSYLAEKALASLAKTAEWNSGSHVSSDQLFEHLQAHAQNGRANKRGESAPGGRDFNAVYTVAYIQHAPMEPRAAVAEWEDGKLTVWTGTQQPGGVRDSLARTFQLPAEKVRVIVPDTGGAFGGKHSGEVAIEAARLAKEAGRPVHVRWTREEEFTWAYFRPAGVLPIKATLGADNRITHWEHVNINSGGSALDTPYDIASVSTEFKNSDAPLRAGSYRALASTANNFARESMMDELAAAADEDPLAFRLRHLQNERIRNALLAAAEKFGWDARWKKRSKTSGVGLSCGTEKGSVVACCAQVDISDQGAYKVVEVVEAFECGPIMNPRNLKAQVEGAIIQGLGGAMREEMRFKNGKILNAHFSKYHVPRFRDVPAITTILLDRRDLPAVGAGETPIIGIAPAIANAIFHATGARIRSMPIRNEAIRSA